MKRQHLIIAAAAAIAIAAALWFAFGRAPSADGFDIETAEAAAGDVRRTVSATGAVSALVTVQVGSQLSGQISELAVDFNSRVTAGQVIARLDPQTYETRVREAESAVAVAEAGLQLQRASLSRVDASLRVAQDSYERIQSLYERGNASQAAYDNAVAALQSARADRQVALAQISNAEATLTQRRASLENARIDLERTVIRSPIDGVVVSRAVDVGQTVAASLQAPTLFTIAQDLSEVQIEAQVDESDIGQVAEGQPASFTVDAYPGRTLEGRVMQVRLSPTSLQNVVTYTVVIHAANPGGRLLPGMTANLTIVTGERQGVLTVPNAALRFRPGGALEARARPAESPQQRGPGAGGQRGSGQGGPAAGGMRMAGGPGAMIDRLAEQLELTPDQTERARAAVNSAVQSLVAEMQQSGGGAAGGGGGMVVMMGPGGAAGGGGTRGANPRAQFQARIDAALQGVLTTEQMARYSEIQAEAAEIRSGFVWVMEADGTLAERRVRLGVADTQRTEVLSGELEAGERVVLRARERA